MDKGQVCVTHGCVRRSTTVTFLESVTSEGPANKSLGRFNNKAGLPYS